jgi:hypothetical protein
MLDQVLSALDLTRVAVQIDASDRDIDAGDSPSTGQAGTSAVEQRSHRKRTGALLHYQFCECSECGLPLKMGATAKEV